MSINQRSHIRFSLDIPALLITKHGERRETVLQQISIGGCFTDWEENIFTGDEFRIEVQLPNRNRLPLKCKALYLFDNTGIGATFLNITRFEQDLISKIIAFRLKQEGLPIEVDPFRRPSTFVSDDDYPELTDARKKKDSILDSIL